MATFPEVKEILVLNNVAVCPHCNAQNGGIRRYNPGTYNVLLPNDKGYYEEELDTEDSDVSYVCEECGGALLVDEKAIRLQPRDDTKMIIRLVDPNDFEELGNYLIYKRDYKKTIEAINEAKQVENYDNTTFEQIATMKGVQLFNCERESIEF